MTSASLTELKELTDSIKAGERVILLPPGIFTLIAIIGLLITATVTFFGSSISIFASEVEIPIKVAIQFTSMGIFLIFVIFPSLMVFQGNKRFSTLSIFYSISLLILSLLLTLAAVTNLINSDASITPLLISFVSSLLAYILLRSTSFLLLKEFFYYLKKT